LIQPLVAHKETRNLPLLYRGSRRETTEEETIVTVIVGSGTARKKEKGAFSSTGGGDAGPFLRIRRGREEEKRRG